MSAGQPRSRRLPAPVAELLRPVFAVGAAAAVVVGATQLGPLAVAAPASGAGAGSAAGSAAQVPVRQSLLACPGPETAGLTGVAAVPNLTTTVYAATAPADALAGIGSAGRNGAGGSAAAGATLRVLARPDGGELVASTTRGATVSAKLAGPSLAEVVGAEGLAPGVAALQTSLLRETDDRGLSALSCSAPAAEAWLLGGGGDSTRRERVVVANPGANVVTVDLEVFGGQGRRPVAGGSRLAVPAHGRVSVLLDGLALGEPTPAVHVVATGGVISAVLEDAWIEAAVGRGRDDSAPAQPPALEQVVPAVLGGGPARLRLLVPGDEEAVVQARLLTSSGPAALPSGGVARVKGGSVLDVDLGAQPPGDYAVQVRADRPVTAAVQVEQRGPAAADPSDLAWVSARPAIGELAGLPVPGGLAARLTLAGVGGPWSATVWLVAADGSVTARSVQGDADSVAPAVELTGAASVWVAADTGTVFGGVRLSLDDAGGPLVSVVGLSPVLVTAARVPVREVRR